MRDMQQGFPAPRAVRHARSHPHRREALRLRGLLQGIQGQAGAEEAPGGAQPLGAVGAHPWHGAGPHAGPTAASTAATAAASTTAAASDLCRQSRAGPATAAATGSAGDGAVHVRRPGIRQDHHHPAGSVSAEPAGAQGTTDQRRPAGRRTAATAALEPGHYPATTVCGLSSAVHQREGGSETGKGQTAAAATAATATTAGHHLAVQAGARNPADRPAEQRTAGDRQPQRQLRRRQRKRTPLLLLPARQRPVQHLL